LGTLKLKKKGMGGSALKKKKKKTGEREKMQNGGVLIQTDPKKAVAK